MPRKVYDSKITWRPYPSNASSKYPHIIGPHSIKTFSDLVADIRDGPQFSNDGSVRINLPDTVLSQPPHVSEGQYKVFECLSLVNHDTYLKWNVIRGR
jgi:hypothetical protein